MICSVQMLKAPAENAGVEVPGDIENYHAAEYPHFFLYVQYQLCRPLPFPSSHWNNAHVIASIPDHMVFNVTLDDLIRRGFE
tara:strand:+ start:135368 stop:135613 length:246 start_codon:yes stop_codon:yes gene_type:complete